MKPAIQITIIIILFSFNAKAQENTIKQNAEQQQIILSEVITVDSTSKNDLYDRAKVWFVKTFNSSKDVIQLDDKENGKIIGKGSFKYEAAAFSPGTNFSGYFDFILTVEFKENRFRYSFENITHTALKDEFSCGSFDNEKPSCGPLFCTIKTWNKMKSQGYELITAMANNLKASMTIKQKKDEW